MEKMDCKKIKEQCHICHAKTNDGSHDLWAVGNSIYWCHYCAVNIKKLQDKYEDIDISLEKYTKYIKDFIEINDIINILIPEPFDIDKLLDNINNIGKKISIDAVEIIQDKPKKIMNEDIKDTIDDLNDGSLAKLFIKFTKEILICDNQEQFLSYRYDTIKTLYEPIKIQKLRYIISGELSTLFPKVSLILLKLTLIVELGGTVLEAIILLTIGYLYGFTTIGDVLLLTNCIISPTTALKITCPVINADIFCEVFVE